MVSIVTATPPRTHNVDRQQAALAALDIARAEGNTSRISTAEQDVVRTHLSVATALARRYRNRGVDQDDLAQVAALGLVKAVRGWDSERESAFMSYACPTIIGEMKRYFRDQSTMIRAPRELSTLHLAVNALTDQLEQRLGRAPDDSELAQAAGVSEQQIRAQRLSSRGCRTDSLDVPGVQAAAAQQSNGAAEVDLGQVENLIVVRAALSGLTARERHILELRFFRGLSQSEIAEATGVSQMQISRILRKLLDTLRDRLGGQGFDLASERAA